ncbi:MAG: hypothetical protein ABIR70_10950 [Bryobacteraceae bacterium]
MARRIKTPIRSRSLSRRLYQIFAGEHHRDVKRGVVGLSALFEDLRIEIAGITARRISKLDETSRRMREYYFLRRSFGTLYEFAEVVEELDHCDGFTEVKSQIKPRLLIDWTEAVAYFAARKAAIERVRSNVGGHFGKRAAKLAIRNLMSEDAGTIEVAEYRSGGGVKLGFASTLAGVALVHSVRGDEGMETKVKELFKLSLEAKTHAVRAVECLAATYLWKRFELG